MFSVKTKIAACMFLLSMLAMAMVLLTVHQSSINALRTNEIHYHVEATNRTRDNFSSLFDSVYKTANLLIENAEISSVLREPPATGSADHTLIRNNLSTLLRTFIYPTQAISAVHIVGTEPGQFYSSIASANEEELRQVCATLLEQSSPQDRYLFTGMSSIEYYPGINRQTIQYVSPVYNTQTRLLMGYVVVDMDYSVLEEMFLTSSYANEDKALVVREDGEIIFKYPYNVTLTSVLEDYPQLTSESSCTIEGKVFGANMLIVSDTIDYTNWRIIRMISRSRITKDTQSIVELMVHVSVVFLCLSFALSLLLSRLLTRPLTTLADAFLQAERGNTGIRVHIRTRDELGRLGSGFNSMMDKLNRYFNRELELQKKKSDMELEVLETQINPHFLYNTLDSIRWLAVIQNVDNLAQMTGALISLLRYNLSKDGPVVTLSKEVESVENYMCIQHFRYGIGLELKKTLDPQTLEMEMPRFILQPLVENCILHAYGQSEEIGIIELQSELCEEEWLLRVVDAGCGMSQDIDLSSVPKGSHFKNIGIPGIRERIRLYYGDGYGLHYHPRPEGGTIAEINLPLRRGGRDRNNLQKL